MSSWVLPFTNLRFQVPYHRGCVLALVPTDGCFSVVAQRVKGVSSSPFRFNFSGLLLFRAMSWHGNWSASSGKGWRRDSWNTSGKGKWAHYGDSQPSWGKGHGKSWNNSWDRGNQLPSPAQPSWIATMAASTVESAVTSSISRSLREAATSWVQSFFSRVSSGPGTLSPPPAVASVPHPGPATTPAVAKASDGEMHDDVICVAQKLIMEVRKAAAVEGLNASMLKAGKKKPSRRPHFKASSSDTSGDEALRKTPSWPDQCSPCHSSASASIVTFPA